MIVGGGPVGTFSALLLARYGIRSTVLERRDTINPHPKSRSISRRTMEILRALDIDDTDLIPLSLPPEWTRVLVYTTTLTGTEIGRVPCPDFESVPVADSPSTPHMSSQEKLERLLRDRALDSDLIEFRGGVSAEGFRQNEHGCELAAVAANGASETVTSDYALFADGASSGAREWLGIDMDGEYAIATVYDVHFDVDGLSERVASRIAPLLFVASDAGIGVYQPIDGRAEWRCQIFTDGEPPDAGAAVTWIRATSGIDELDVRVRSIRPWTMHSLMAQRFRAGRAFLLGDAAHVLPPTGGLGLNSGFQGAHNLAWKLAGVIAGWGGERLLDTYEQERRPVTQVNAEASFRNNANFSAIGQAWRSGGDLDGALRRAASYGRFAGLDLGVRYAEGAFAADGGAVTPLAETIGTYDGAASPGVRAPHVWMNDGAVRLSSLDLFDRGFCLLGGSAAEPWVRAALELGRRRGIPLTACAVNGAQSRIRSEDFSCAYGIGETGAVLVRPDGHIGFRSNAAVSDPAGALGDALSACVVQTP